MRFNFRKIASVLSSTIMVSSTVALAAAATYPAPFVQGGNADVGVVFGSAPGAQLDLAAVVDLTSDLQFRLASQTASSGTTSSGTTISGGDNVQLKKPSDNINLGNTLSGVFGTSVTDDDLGVLLADGTYSNDENTEYDYEQKLTLGALTLSHFADSDYKDKEPTIGFRITSGTPIVNYTIDFTTDPESDIVSNELADLETTDLPLLGRNYYILDADLGTGATYYGTFTLLDSANTAIITEGETQTVTIADKSYEVGINFIGSTSVRIDVNGEVTNSLASGGTYKLSDGTYVGIKDILFNSKDTGVSKVEISLGTGKLEIESNADVELNDNDIDGLKGYVYRGSNSSGKERLDKIVLEWIADEETYIADGEGSLTFPGFEAVQFTAGSFFRPYKEVITVQNDGDDSIELSVPIKDGTAKFNILYANASGEFVGIGKDATEKLATSNTSLISFNATSDADKWFVVSWASTTDSESYLLEASVTGSGTTDSKFRTTIKNSVTGKDVCSDKTDGDECDIGSATITINNVTKAGSHKWFNATAGSGVTFNHIFTKEGLKIYLPFNTTGLTDISTPKGAVNFDNQTSAVAGYSHDTFVLFMDEEDKDDNIGSGDSINLTINDNSDGDLQVSDIDSSESEHEIEDTDVFTTFTISDVATEMKIYKNPDQDWAEVIYSGGESFMDVFLAAPEASVTTGSSGTTGGTVSQLGNIAVSDNEVSSVSGKNLIVVGGSCVNSFAAQLLGVSYPTCGSNWESTTNVGSGSFLVQTFDRSGDKVATLIAGYNAGDTASGIKKLTSEPGSFDISSGKAYTGDQSSVTMVDVAVA